MQNFQGSTSQNDKMMSSQIYLDLSITTDKTTYKSFIKQSFLRYWMSLASIHTEDYASFLKRPTFWHCHKLWLTFVLSLSKLA